MRSLSSLLTYRRHGVKRAPHGPWCWRNLIASNDRPCGRHALAKRSGSRPRQVPVTLAEGQGVEPSTSRCHGFQDRLPDQTGGPFQTEPAVGLEPTTSGLQNHCTTAVRSRQRLDANTADHTSNISNTEGRHRAGLPAIRGSPFPWPMRRLRCGRILARPALQCQAALHGPCALDAVSNRLILRVLPPAGSDLWSRQSNGSRGGVAFLPATWPDLTHGADQD